ncbi:MAG: ABC transporter substrate-binding protein [Pseudomonadota bacterium]
MSRAQRASYALAFIAALATGPVMAADDEIRIGFLGGVTGPVQYLAPAILSAARLAVGHINADGGLLNGRQVRLSVGDTRCTDATQAANAADRLVHTEEVVAIVGALCSGATLSAARNTTVPDGVVMVSPASTAPSISTIDDDDLVFRFAPSDAYAGQVMARLMMRKGIRTVAIAHVDADYGAGFADAFQTAFEAIGGTVTLRRAHSPGQASYAEDLEALAESGAPTLLIAAIAESSGLALLQEAIRSGRFKRFAGSNAMVSDRLFSLQGMASLKNMVLIRSAVPQSPGRQAFEALAAAAGADPDAPFAAEAYDAAFLLALAIESHGKPDRTGLAQALRSVSSPPGTLVLPGEWEKARALIADGKSVNYEGAAGPHDFDARGDVPGRIVELAIRGGGFHEVGLLD